MKTVGAFQAKTQLSQLLDQVEKGEVVTITRHGRPVAVLAPIAPVRWRLLVGTYGYYLPIKTAANGLDISAIGVYTFPMEFMETQTFTRLLTGLLADDEYREMQYELLENPARGDSIKGGGGVRKLRFAVQGRGKSGGVRVIYYWIKDKHLIYMLLIYSKSKKDDLTDKETAILRELVKEL